MTEVKSRVEAAERFCPPGLPARAGGSGYGMWVVAPEEWRGFGAQARPERCGGAVLCGNPGVPGSGRTALAPWPHAAPARTSTSSDFDFAAYENGDVDAKWKTIRGGAARDGWAAGRIARQAATL